MLLAFLAVAFNHAVVGGPSLTGFPAIAGVLAVASIPTDPGISILAVFFIYCIVQ